MSRSRRVIAQSTSPKKSVSYQPTITISTVEDQKNSVRSGVRSHHLKQISSKHTTLEIQSVAKRTQRDVEKLKMQKFFLIWVSHMYAHLSYYHNKLKRKVMLQIVKFTRKQQKLRYAKDQVELLKAQNLINFSFIKWIGRFNKKSI